jgi:linoleoyl-CoA desaturase
MVGEAGTDRTISYEELKRHSSYSDAWIAIDGTVYDITDFIDNHPCGDTFRGSLGADCSGLFMGSHINTSADVMLANPRFHEKNGIKIVGRLDVSRDHLAEGNPDPYLERVVYKKMADDRFWQDLKQEVQAFLEQTHEVTHYTFGQGLAFVVYYLAIWAALSYLAWIKGSMLASALLGFHMLCAVANVSHMVTHFGYTRHYWLNFVAAHLFDLGGMSWFEWQIAHQTHHNQPHSAIDYQTNTYDDILGTRLHRRVPLKARHRYQRFYFWIVVSPYLLFRIFATSLFMIQNRRLVRHWYEWAGHVLARAIFFLQIIYCAHLLGWLRALLVLLAYSTAYSYSAFILLYNDHESTHQVLDAERDITRYHGKMSWTEVQVRTSNNWYPTSWLTAFVEFHYGYFNYHIEHHLFPSFKPMLMKKVSPIVRRVCAKHGVPYTLTTFMEVQHSLQQHMTKMGRPPVAEQPGA